jgi:hypothetical protein
LLESTVPKINAFKFIGYKRQSAFVLDREKPRLDMCLEHTVPRDKFFPHLVKAHIQNGTVVDPLLAAVVCWTVFLLDFYKPQV